MDEIIGLITVISTSFFTFPTFYTMYSAETTLLSQ